MVTKECRERDGTMVRCALCGKVYVRASCRRAGCPLGKHCRMLTCPYCGYRTVDVEASTAGRWLQRLLGRGEEEKAHG